VFVPCLSERAMNKTLNPPETLRRVSRDIKLLFTTRGLRLFAYGMISVVLVLYLTEIGLDENQVGLLLSLTLAGDVVISLGLTSVADRFGRRRTLLIGAALMVFAGVAFALTRNLAALTAAAIIGTISPSGNEVGPFLAVEQAALSQTIRDEARTRAFAWYSLTGSLATALGALCGGTLAEAAGRLRGTPVAGYRTVVICYALLGLVLGALFARLSPEAEVAHSTEVRNPAKSSGLLGLQHSRNIVLRLSALFMVDAFAGGLVVQSLVAYWFHSRFGVAPGLLGAIFFGANVFAGLSALLAASLAARFGLIRTMVWTHVPSNILLMLIPLMPNLPLAIAVLLARFSISQMDVPTRQSYTMAVVDPAERAAAAGIANVARTGASALAPLVTGRLFGAALMGIPFILSGSLKIMYDFALYRSFHNLKPPEERSGG
jgi:MFS family permease